jgi:hypothetical protein
MCPSALFMETASDPPEHEKWCVVISCIGQTRMHYVIPRFHRMQKYKFAITCPDVLFIETAPGSPKHEK